MEGMKETLISISQLCNGGLSGSQNVVIFTSEGMRCFSIESIREALALIDKLGVEIIRGYISNGVYVYNQNEEKSINEVITKEDVVHKTPSPSCKEITINNKNSATLYLTQFKPVSLYDHVHMVTGYPGNIGMLWHLKSSTNAKFTEEDANKQRGPCKGCVYGTMHQTGTDHRREHRDLPVKPGQSFSLDAYQHDCYSARGYKHCDIYTDLATRRCYPVDNPLGLIDIASWVDLPLGDQPSSRSTEMRAIPLNLRPSSPIRQVR